MNNLLRAIAGLLLAAGACVAAAAPIVPSSEMPGRERDRFTDSPVQRFMEPGLYQSPPVLQPLTPCGVRKPHSKSRAAKQKNC